jgi:hypothetical protein
MVFMLDHIFGQFNWLNFLPGLSGKRPNKKFVDQLDTKLKI